MTRLREVLRWVFAGRYRWGHATSRSSRYGSHTIEVHIYPPSTTGAVRTCMHLVRFWFPFAAITTLAATTTVPLAWEIVLAVKCGIVLTALAALRAATADARRGTKTLSGRRHFTDDEPGDAYLAAAHTWDRMHDLEYRLDTGLSSPEQFRADWHAEYSSSQGRPRGAR